MFNNPMGKLFSICEWIMKLAYVNLLWLLFTLAGFILLGWMPSTVALFTIVRKWILKDAEVPIWSTFLSTYKKDFLKINVSGLIFTVLGGLLYIDYYLVLNFEGFIRIVMISILLLMSLLYLITFVFFFPVYVHFDLKQFEYFKYAILLGSLNFHIFLVIIVGLFIDIFLLLYIPSLIPFFSGVSIACIIMSGCFYIFQRLQKIKITEGMNGYN